MKITHCIASIDKSTGGPARSSTHLINALQNIEGLDEVNLFTLRTEDPISLEPSIKEKGKYYFFSYSSFGYSKELKNHLFRIKPDVFHGHGIWDLTIHQMASFARKNRIPYVVSVRGMLEPWSMQQSKLKKKIALLLYQKRDLSSANCLHATAESELASIRELGYTNPVAVIPNGIEIESFPIRKSLYKKKAKRTILFLSRIHHKKGIEILIEAWSRLSDNIKNDWKVEIVGNGSPDYIDTLRRLIVSKGLQEEIMILGPKFGREKVIAYQQADLFVLPTYSENFGVVIAEALACGIPVITTKGAPWKDLEEYNAGEWIDIGVEPLCSSLSNLMTKSSIELVEMGKNGRTLVEQKYSIDSVAGKFFELYRWLDNKSGRPYFVNTI